MKRKRVPWRSHHIAGEVFVTLPVYLAYCGVAAALRAYNRPDASFRAILVVESEEAMDCYLRAARVFLGRLCDDPYDQPVARELATHGKKGLFWDDNARSGNARRRAIFVATALEQIDDEIALGADVVAIIPAVTERRLQAALKRSGIRATAEERAHMLLESWQRLSLAFLPGRSATKALQRLLRQRPPPAKKPEKSPATANGPSLDDLSGYGALCDWGRELALDLRLYKEGQIEWDDVDAGVLISGPPGTGKTLFAGALAKTCDVPVVYGTAAQWQAKGYLNDFLKAMNRTFADAESEAPCILFIDEIDAFGDRSIPDHNSDYKRQAINGLLERLDGFERRIGIIVVAACNDPEKLDPAIRRAGRLDRHFAISPPDEKARLGILAYYADLKLSDTDAARFLRATEGFTGADIRQLVKEAKRLSRRSAEVLAAPHMLASLPQLICIPPETMRRAAIHEAGHAIVGLELGCAELK